MAGKYVSSFERLSGEIPVSLPVSAGKTEEELKYVKQLAGFFRYEAMVFRRVDFGNLFSNLLFDRVIRGQSIVGHNSFISELNAPVVLVPGHQSDHFLEPCPPNEAVSGEKPAPANR